MIRSLATLALPLALAGCWAGEPFYTDADARPAIPPGEYRFVYTPEGETREGTGTVSILPSGLTRMGPEKELEDFGFAPLPGSSDRFVGWQKDSDDDGEPDERVPYWLLLRSGGEFQLTIPMCEKTKDIALAAGATLPEDVKIATCVFPSRAALEGALLKVEVERQDAVVLRPK